MKTNSIGETTIRPVPEGTARTWLPCRAKNEQQPPAVIVPIDAEAIKPALEEAKDKGVPVILKARGANGVAGVDYVTGIMSDFVWEGNQAGKWISAAAKKKGLQKVRVIEIQGVIGGTDVRDRGQGFQNAADEAGN
jgi:galactofuranose transport system substrate-binding protein